MWEQLNVAVSFDMTEIWILNVGDLKFLESPLEYFLSIAYDAPANRRAAPQWPPVRHVPLHSAHGAAWARGTSRLSSSLRKAAQCLDS